MHVIILLITYTLHKVHLCPGGPANVRDLALTQAQLVFLKGELLAQLRTFCTPADVVLLLCGNPAIDVADWRASTTYTGGLAAGDELVAWFWSMVGALDNEHRAKLLHFSTGSSRAPAGGFAQLQG